MDYETLTNEELYKMAYIQEDPQAQEEYIRRARLLWTKELLKWEQESK